MVYFIKILNIFRIIEQLHKKNLKNPRRVICVTEYKVTAERISIVCRFKNDYLISNK